MAKQFLDYAGLQEFWNKIKEFVADQIRKSGFVGDHTHPFSTTSSQSANTTVAGSDHTHSVSTVTGVTSTFTGTQTPTGKNSGTGVTVA